MDPSLQAMLQQHCAAASHACQQAQALGASFIALLPFGIGDRVTLHSDVAIKVSRITFERECYQRDSAWHPGFRVVGTQYIGNTLGSTSQSAVFDLAMQRVVYR